MKDEIKARFERALALDQAERDDQEALRQQTETKAKSLEAEWSHRVASELLPALGPITQMMTEKGWVFNVTTPANGLEISAYRGDMRAAAGSGRPYLKLSVNAASGMISIYQSTQSAGRSDPEGYKVGEITADFLQERVAQFLEALTKTKPPGF